ncbi:DUF2490 domain-containing protein [Sphingomonas rubra]|uniref:DUF2490 domain-containing protein n=1 Tax=Sphingomonas rubra TaxID=634430 RepID=A0A1I5PRH4_9SPHN|nr:DUF2490 domain-containing protein [Sphingomonas rubra]SFP36517.1 Protein of unknown function [Sphingomonas rubra]
MFPRLLAAACLAATFLVVATPAAARTEHDLSSWTNVTVQGPVAGDLVFFAEIQPRVQQDVSHLDQLLLRGAIGYKVTPRLTLYQGYLHVAEPLRGRRDRNEERPFQQATWLVPVPHGELQSRTRFEQRFRSDGNDVAFRLRQMLRYELPAGKGKARPLIHAEAFVALNDADWGPRAGFDQLRTFAGAEVPLFGTSTAELGYMNQTVNRTGGAVLVNHIASVTMFVRL